MSSGPGDRRNRMAVFLDKELVERAQARLASQEAAAMTGGPEDTPEQLDTGVSGRLSADVLKIAASALRIAEDKLDPQENLANFGVDSIAITEVMAQISKHFGISVAPTTFFEAKHLDDLSTILMERYCAPIEAHYAAQPSETGHKGEPAIAEGGSGVTPKPEAPAASPQSEGAGQESAWMRRYRGVFGPAKLKKPKARETRPATPTPPVSRTNTQGEPSNRENGAVPIAIVSMEGMFPQSPDLDAFEAHLSAGDDCMEEVPAERWDWRSVFGDPKKGAFTDVKYGGFIPDADHFDAGFFNISPREAELMDPQHRLFMECVWSLIEKGGYAPGALSGRKIGLFVGINLLDYTDMVNRAGIMDAQQLTGLGHAFCPNRLSFLLDIHGPSEVVDTACSSSLVAIHRAVTSIRHEGCEMAIAGGSNLLLSPMQHIMFSKVGMITPDGRCKTFSKDADGYARSDGVGAVLLKRLDLAERDGDPILGVIRGSAEHHGGSATSLTAPNPKAQARLIVDAHRQAGTDPRTIGMIECHGTGTPLGDPVEVEGLKLAFRELYEDWNLEPPAQAAIGLGSVKSNIGHTETAAGVAGLIKVLLAMKNRTLFQTLHASTPNPLLELDGSPFYLLQNVGTWERPVVDGEEQPLRAGVSSFGAGGANVHLVIEEYRQTGGADRIEITTPVVVPLSAKNEAALDAGIARLREAAGQTDLGELAYTLQTGRDAMRCRAAFVAKDSDELTGKLDAYLGGDTTAAMTGKVPGGRRDKTAPLDPSGKNAEELARHWAAGGDIDWYALYGKARPHRIALPSYAFQRKRYWLPEEEGKRQSAAGSLTPKPTDAGQFSLTLTGKEVFLADHKVGGSPVLPGVAYLELVGAAAVQNGLTNPALRRVVWMAPLRVEKPTEVFCAFSDPETGGAKAEVFSVSETGDRLLHAQMQVEKGEKPVHRSIDPASLKETAGQKLPKSEIYAAFDRIGLVYGPGHRVINQLTISGEDTADVAVLAELELPQAMAASLSGFALHPSLLDGALQSAIGLAWNEDDAGTALPFSIDSVDILGPCEAKMWARVRPAGTAGTVQRKMDLDLIAEDGSIRVAIKGFATRLLKTSEDAEILRFEPRQRPLPAGAGQDGDRRRIVLLAGASKTADDLRGLSVDWDVRVLDDDRTAPLDQRYRSLARQLLEITQSALSSGPVLVQLVLEITEDDTPLGGLASMFRSIHREHRAVCGQVLSFPEATSAGELRQALLKSTDAPAGARIRPQHGELTMEVWEEIPALDQSAEMPWRSDAVYLLTGGTGKLGQDLAREILHHAPGCTVILATRSEPDPATAAWIGATPGLHHKTADLSDHAAVGRLVQEIRQTHGQLDGVLHMAGVLEDEAFARKTAAQLDAVLAPKVSGAVALDSAIGDAPLDFFVLYSSISGVVGNTGQADYSAANSFLDGFAQAREARRLTGACHGRTVSIAWPLWRGGGMALSKPQEDLMRRTTGLAPLDTGAGLTALCGALTGTAPQVMIAAGKADRIRRFVSEAFVPETPAQQPQASSGPAQPAENPSTDPALLRRRLLASLTEIASDQLKVDEGDLDPDEELTEYGFDSIGFTQFANRLNDRFDLELTPTLFFEYPTLDGLAGYLSEEDGARLAAALGVTVSAATVESKKSDLETPQAPVTPAEPPRPGVPAAAAIAKEYRHQPDAPIAIIGMSGQFPGAPDVDAFWQLLKDGRNAISEVPEERWDWREYWGDPLTEPGKGNVKWGGFVDGIADFDAAFFGVTPPEARMMDPQHRLLLTQAWRVMEDAGYAPSSLAGSDTGVFVGTADTGYSRLVADAGVKVEGYSMTGLAPSLGPNRISYFYDFHGPSVAVETACSSALIAVHRAVEALRSGYCSLAIAGGVNSLLLPEAFVGFAKAGMLSPEGRCKPFSARADGYARGEGVGLIMLKPLADAQRDGDRILAVVRSSAENHGGHAASLTAPNPKAQADLIRNAYTRSGIDPRTVGYIEAHGTGTPLGDPIEIEALATAFSDLTRDAEATYGAAPEQVCAIGSVKSNIGHLELAAGIAGLIKVLLQFRHGEIAKSLSCEDPNPYLKLEGSPFHLADHAETWRPSTTVGGESLPRRAGVSSFGFGGTNAHVVLEEYQPASAQSAPQTGNEPELIVLSARTEAQLKETAERFIQFLSQGSDTPALADIAYTLQIARDAMEVRLGFLASSPSEMLERLRAFVEGRDSRKLHIGSVKAGRKTTSIFESDGPLRDAAAGLAERGRADDLLGLWVGGFGVDWPSVRQGRPGSRILLPGYPFAKNRYWVGEGPGVQNAPRAQTAAAQAAFALAVDGSESYLRDHKVNGAKILPGVFSFELLNRSLEAAGGKAGAFELTGHTWVGAVTADKGALELQVDLVGGSGGNARYTISAVGNEGTQRHAEGVFRKLSDSAAPTLDLKAARAAAGNAIDVAGLYREFEDLGLNYGPAQRAIAQAWRGDGIAVARLDVPEDADTGFALHPSILDGALQAVLALEGIDNGGNRLALPYSIRRTTVYGSTLETMWAVVRKGDNSFDISLCDEQGNIFIKFEGFVTRPAEAGNTQTPDRALSTPAGEAERQKRALEIVTAIAARILEVEPASLDVDTELGDFGFDSVSMTGFASQMNAELGLALTPADFFEYATLAKLAGHICGDLTDEQLGLSGATSQEGEAETALKTAAASHRTPSRQVQVAGPFYDDDPIVIVGQSCCFPLAEDADAFWDNLISGRDCITKIPADRWSWQELDGDPRQEPDKTNIHWGGFIDRVFEFDPLFFGISPREAKLMDPQQRLMMLHAWKAIEDAGHAPRSLAGQKVGVFVGTSSSGYRDLIGSETGGEGYVATGSVPSVGPNRISYFLDLHGPSEPVETACSSSLVALHRAVQSIKAGDCDMALVGGVNTIITPEAHINFARAGMLSADGRCKTFSADANGYVRGEGAGMLFVRRLSDAERDGDPILAVVRGTAINHGGHANSLTAPNTSAQTDLLTTAYRSAGVDPRTVGYIEAHGTGTALGDPVEVNALKSAFNALSNEQTPIESGTCGLGSVKTNIGHLELAAGVAGVIKVLKQIEHHQLAPSLNCKDINPYIDFENSPFRVVREPEDWQPLHDESGCVLPLRAGISSFGFGGVNAHVVLEEYRPVVSDQVSRARTDGPQIVVLSARDKTRLKDNAQALLQYLESGDSAAVSLPDLAFTLQVGRTEMAKRLAIVSESLTDLRAGLSAFLGGETSGSVFVSPENAQPSQVTTRQPGGQPEEIARHWVEGGKVDWLAVNPGPHRRLRLPTYCFARDEYRIGKAHAVGRSQTGTMENQVSNGTVKVVEAEAFYVKDHVVRGSRILPGAMSIEIACQAALATPGFGKLPVALTDIIWRKPVELNSGLTALKVLFADDNGSNARFRIVPETGDPIPYVTGKASPLFNAVQPSPVDLVELQTHCRTAHDPDWLYACYSALGIDYGPSLRAITELRTGGNDVLARLRLPDAAARQNQEFLLHPSLLDAAFQAVLVAFASEGDAGLALPFALDRLEVYRPTTPDMWAHLRLLPTNAGIRKLDIDLLVDTGKVSLRIKGFSLKDLNAPAPTRPSALAQTAKSGDARGGEVERYFTDLIARETELDASSISLSAPLEDYGIDSVLIMRLTDLLEQDFGKLPKTLFFEHQTLDALIGYFRDRHGDRLSELLGGEVRQDETTIPAPKPTNTSRRRTAADEPIAIIGVAGRYPGARTLEDFWQNLADGRDCITEVPGNRWDHSKYYDPDRKAGKTTSRWGGFVDGHDRFDPMFFNIAPREAQFMDPQERLFLECAWETLEDAGYTRARLSKNANGMAGADAGVFVGVMWDEYQLYGSDMAAAGQPVALSGNAASIANRVSYFLNFHGPSLALDTMCSSSLTAIHLACESLRSGGCSVALAGGVNLTTHPNKYVALAQGRFLSSTGRCESFGEGGDGYVPAEGVGAVLLKPLSQAEADGDRIYGVILGSALNHGGKTNGYTVPNLAAQSAVVQKALSNAGVSPKEISFVEAHGTGTSLGDPIEIEALTRVFGGAPDGPGRCAIGSVKSNIGHAESAAGIAGLTKVLLQFKHRKIAPSLHSRHLNPHIDFDASPFHVQQTLETWEAKPESGTGGCRIAGLSSFGAGGSNAHFVIGEYAASAPAVVPSGPAVYPFSARDAERLTVLLSNFRAHLDQLPEDDMPSVAFTLQEGREALEDRLAVVADGKTDLASKLDQVLAGTPQSDGIYSGRAALQARDIGRTSGIAEAADTWVRGGAVDWAALRPGPKPLPISLPSYPFAQDYCWLPEIAPEAKAISAPPQQGGKLPLLFAPVWKELPGTIDADTPVSNRLHVLCGLASSRPSLAAELEAGGAGVRVLDAAETEPHEAYEFYALEVFKLLKDLARNREDAVIQVVVPADGEGRLLEGLSGLLRCAALENKGWSCQLVCADPSLDDLADRLAVDAKAAGQQTEIRYRDGARLLRSFEEVRPETASVLLQWKDGGVYLLTGGAGGVGLHIAREIATGSDKPILWLTGRSSLTPALEQRLQELETAGATVRYRSVDVTDGAAVTALVEEICKTDGDLTGIFHGAGVTRDGLLAGKTETNFKTVLAPKVAGTAALDQAVGTLPIDFFVLLASATGALGNPGQTDYGAANAFLDRFAAWRNAQTEQGVRHGRTISIDWPYWRDGGMQMDAQTIQLMERTAGVRPLETGPAIEALKTILASVNQDQVLVLEGDHARLRKLMAGADTPAPAKPESSGLAAVKAGPLSDADGAPDRPATVAMIKSAFSKSLGIPEERLDEDSPIDRFGVDSVSAIEIVEALEADFGPLSQTILFEFQTIGRLADELAPRAAPTPSAAPAASEPAAPKPSADRAPDEVGSIRDQDVAIIAVAGRFPGAETIEDFADLLRGGRDCVTEVPPDRADLLNKYSPNKGEPGASYCKWGAFLKDVDRFDAQFFGYSPRIAELTDPQERLFLETAWHLFERAGHTRPYLAEHYGKSVGVFVGSMYNQYPALAAEDDAKALLSLNSYAAIANRVSFFFDLQGPSVAVDSMCSSGLQAVHQACQSLKLGECRLAVAGGVNLTIHPAKFEALSRTGLVGSNPDERAFGGGDGYLPAEGVGAVLLKPLSDALSDQDKVLGVIKASLANHSGHSAGYAVPNADAQVKLLERTYQAAGIDPETIDYVEAAATGSKVGDAIELRALSDVFAGAGERKRSVALGSVKTNMGHAEAASGLAQLAKVLLQFQRHEFFPSFVKGGIEGVFDGTPFKPQLDLKPWTSSDGAPLRAAISSFGAGGSNVHLILEEAQPEATEDTAPPPQKRRPFPMSARSRSQLEEVRKDLAGYIRSAKEIDLAALSRTLCHGRERLDVGITYAASSVEDLLEKLESPLPEDLSEAGVPDGVEMEPRIGPMLVLPGYPFARDRYWLKQATTEAVAVKNTVVDQADASQHSPSLNSRSDALPVIRSLLASELGMAANEIDKDAGFASLGVDSIARMRLAYELEKTFGVVLPSDDWDWQQTPAQLAGIVESQAENEEQATPEIRKQDRTGPYHAPLGTAQAGLWVYQSLYPQSADYNVPMAFKCTSIDRDALQQTLDWLVARHPILATRVVVEDDTPWLTARSEPIEIQPIALSKEIETVAYLKQRAAIPFDLEESVFRVEHASGGKLDHAHSIVLITAHHSVTDGLTSEILTRDFWAAYRHFAHHAPLPETGLDGSADYSEFVDWEMDFARSEKGKEQKSYWLDVLKGPLPRLKWRVAQKDRQNGGTGDSLDLDLPEDLVAELAEAAKAQGVSSSSIYLTAFAALLYRYTGERDLVIGLPALRRPSRRFAETVGYCANVIALRLAVDPARTGAEITERVQADLAAGLARSDYPFADIARELGGTETGDVPYEVTFAYQGFGESLGTQAGFASGEVELMPGIRQTGGSSFGIEVQRTEGQVRLIASFDGNLFRSETVTLMLQHYQILLESLARGGTMPVAQMPLLTPPEEDRALHHWSRSGRVTTAADPVHELILTQAKKTPNAVAISDANGKLFYKNLTARSHHIALALEKLQLKEGDRVAVLLGREADSVAVMIAAFSMGAVWVPIDPDMPDERIAFVLEDAGAAAVVTRGSQVKRLRHLSNPPGNILDLDTERRGLINRFARFTARDVKPEDPAYMIYTSGSTGRPKGVVVSHKALSAHCQVIAGDYGLSPKDVVLQFASTSVDTALEQILPVLTVGGRLELRPEGLQAPSAFLRYLQEKGITVADLPPVYLSELLRSWESSDEALASLPLRLMIVGGETFTPDLLKLWNRSKLSDRRLINAYGPTEATITALLHTVKANGNQASVPIGRPLPGTEIYILDRDGNLVSDGLIGELHIGGDRLADGYYQRPDLTAEKFSSQRLGERTVRLYSTGDLASYRPNSGGVVEFHGRIDDQVKIRGHRIELGEVEAALSALGIAEVAVVMDMKRAGDAVLTAYLGTDKGQAELAEVKRQLAKTLPAHMVPADWVFVDSLPKTVSGKIDRNSLAALKGTGQRNSDMPEAARDWHEDRLTEIWVDVLGRDPATERPGLEDDFGDAGGNSLLTIRLLSRIQAEFGDELSVTDLAGASTISSQARLLREKGNGASAEEQDLKSDLPAQASLLVKLKNAGETGSPRQEASLFLVHPAAGTLTCYQQMVAALEIGGPVYGLRANGLEPGEICGPESLENLASGYCNVIRSVQPDGPYRLCGWSYGGVLAFEMARQLTRDGHKVSFVGLVDSYAPDDLKAFEQAGHDPENAIETTCEKAFLRDLFGADVGVEPGQDVIELARSFPQFELIFPGGTSEDLRRLFAVYSAHYRLVLGYDPDQVDVPLHLVRAKEGTDGDYLEGWAALTRSDVQLHIVDANHFSILDKPNLDSWLPGFCDVMEKG